MSGRRRGGYTLIEMLAVMLFAAIVLVLVLGRRVSMKTAIPFGPALIAAGVVAAVLEVGP